MPTHPTIVWIDRDTADIALTELQALVENATAETTLGNLDQAIDDLDGALTAPIPRTQIKRHGDIEACQLPGVPTGTVAIDYYHDQPRLLVHAGDTEEPSHNIPLPSDEQSSSTDAPQTSESSADQSREEPPTISRLIAQLRARERDLVAAGTVSMPEFELIEFRHDAAEGAVILQYDYARAFRTDRDETFDFLL
jgi:hypothetical protein